MTPSLLAQKFHKDTVQTSNSLKCCSEKPGTNGGWFVICPVKKTFHARIYILSVIDFLKR